MIDFTSERKRMTVIVKAPSGEIKVMCKGADSVLVNLLADTKKNEIIKQRSMEHL